MQKSVGIVNEPKYSDATLMSSLEKAEGHALIWPKYKELREPSYGSLRRRSRLSERPLVKTSAVSLLRMHIERDLEYENEFDKSKFYNLFNPKTRKENTSERRHSQLSYTLPSKWKWHPNYDHRSSLRISTPSISGSRASKDRKQFSGVYNPIEPKYLVPARSTVHHSHAKESDIQDAIFKMLQEISVHKSKKASKKESQLEEIAEELLDLDVKHRSEAKHSAAKHGEKDQSTRSKISLPGLHRKKSKITRRTKKRIKQEFPNDQPYSNQKSQKATEVVNAKNIKKKYPVEEPKKATEKVSVKGSKKTTEALHSKKMNKKELARPKIDSTHYSNKPERSKNSVEGKKGSINSKEMKEFLKNVRKISPSRESVSTSVHSSRNRKHRSVDSSADRKRKKKSQLISKYDVVNREILKSLDDPETIEEFKNNIKKLATKECTLFRTQFLEHEKPPNLADPLDVERYLDNLDKTVRKARLSIEGQQKNKRDPDADSISLDLDNFEKMAAKGLTISRTRDLTKLKKKSKSRAQADFADTSLEPSLSSFLDNVSLEESFADQNKSEESWKQPKTDQKKGKKPLKVLYTNQNIGKVPYTEKNKDLVPQEEPQSIKVPSYPPSSDKNRRKSGRKSHKKSLEPQKILKSKKKVVMPFAQYYMKKKKDIVPIEPAPLEELVSEKTPDVVPLEELHEEQLFDVVLEEETEEPPSVNLPQNDKGEDLAIVEQPRFDKISHIVPAEQSDIRKNIVVPSEEPNYIKNLIIAPLMQQHTARNSEQYKKKEDRGSVSSRRSKYGEPLVVNTMQHIDLSKFDTLFRENLPFVPPISYEDLSKLTPEEFLKYFSGLDRDPRSVDYLKSSLALLKDDPSLTYNYRVDQVRRYLYESDVSLSELDNISIDDIDLNTFLNYPYPEKYTGKHSVPKIPPTVPIKKITPKRKLKVEKPKRKKAQKGLEPKVIKEPIEKKEPKCEPDTSPVKHCCCICNSMQRNKPIRDDPLIVRMKNEMKRHELKAYIKEKQVLHTGFDKSFKNDRFKFENRCVLVPCPKPRRVCNQIYPTNVSYRNIT